jgi:hypothetical protein
MYFDPRRGPYDVAPLEVFRGPASIQFEKGEALQYTLAVYLNLCVYNILR